LICPKNSAVFDQWKKLINKILSYFFSFVDVKQSSEGLDGLTGRFTSSRQVNLRNEPFQSIEFPVAGVSFFCNQWQGCFTRQIKTSKKSTLANQCNFLCCMRPG
jgi:hypothetical protein